jgi:dihydrofolate reductase
MSVQGTDVEMAKRVKMPSVSYIVARSYPGNVIGYKNKLPWHISSDLKNFRKMTSGHAVIMGRSTFESIGRALPNRANIVMSKTPPLLNITNLAFDNQTQLYWTGEKEDALFAADILSIIRGNDDIFIIGGQTMYELFGPIVNKVYLTQVFADVTGDAHFAMEFNNEEWRCRSEEEHGKNYEGDEYPYRFSIYERKIKIHRYKLLAQIFGNQSEKIKWIESQVQLDKKIIENYVQENLEFPCQPDPVRAAL